MLNRNKLFLSFLRIGLTGDRTYLSQLTLPIPWEEIYKQAQRQTVLGLVFDGIQLLPKDKQPPRVLMLKWFGVVMQIEKQNKRLNKGLIEIVSAYRAHAIEPILLKGQGVAQYYHNPLHRQGGDIDLLLGKQYDEANKLVSSWGVTLHPETSYHLAFSWKNVEIENHRIFVNFYHPRNKKKLKKWLCRHQTDRPSALSFGEFSVKTPSAQTNAVYLLLHLLHHSLQVGIGLRQVCDWTRLMIENQDKIDTLIFRDDLELLPIKRFACALASLSVRYLGMPSDVFPYDLSSKTIQEDGEFLLKDMLAVGNFGKDTRTWHQFSLGTFKGKIYAYLLAFQRQIRIARFCPSEVMAYPFQWFLSKI